VLTTFDECYDGNRRYLIFGAAFHPSHKIIHRTFRDAKKQAGFKTTAYRLKKKLFKERYGQDIEER
jgi:hypothetical protein